MDQEQARCVVRTVLAVMARIARKTSTQADDLMVAVLQSNQDKIVEAVRQLLPTPGTPPPTDEQIAQALQQAGIWV